MRARDARAYPIVGEQVVPENERVVKVVLLCEDKSNPPECVELWLDPEVALDMRPEPLVALRWKTNGRKRRTTHWSEACSSTWTSASASCGGFDSRGNAKERDIEAYLSESHAELPQRRLDPDAAIVQLLAIVVAELAEQIDEREEGVRLVVVNEESCRVVVFAFHARLGLLRVRRVAIQDGCEQLVHSLPHVFHDSAGARTYIRTSVGEYTLAFAVLTAKDDDDDMANLEWQLARRVSRDACLT